MKSNDQPAFPVADPFLVNCPLNVAEATKLQQGMTLRDYFAAKLASTMIISSTSRTKREIAAYAYEVADEMLEVRKL